MYTRQTAKREKIANLIFALEDVQATLTIWDRDETADSRYLEKLREERDVILEALQLRIK